MAIREIRTYPDHILREKAKQVTEFNEELKQLARDMAETMYAAPGVGLAANQVGVAKRLIVVDVRDPEDKEKGTGLFQLANPEVVEGEGEFVMEEGCLSVPDEREEVERFNKIKLTAQDLDGNFLEIEAEGLLAVVFQHETDHLNGILFIDHLSPLKRAAIRKRLRKQKAEKAASG